MSNTSNPGVSSVNGLGLGRSKEVDEKFDHVMISPQPTHFVRPISSARFVCAIIAQSSIGVLFGLDNTIAANVQGPILDSLGEIAKIPWVGVGFPMGSAAIIFFLGYVFRHYEYKRIFIGSIVLFEIGSAICGAAPTMNALIFGRVIAGMGGAGIYLGALNYVTVIASRKEGALLNALMGLCFGSGCILGPAVGGAFSGSSATWRWAFYINLPVCAVFAPFFIWGYPTYEPNPNASLKEKLAQLDWVGVTLNIAVFTLFQIATNFSGSLWPWSSGSAIAIWVVLGVLTILLIVQQTFCIFTTEQQRILPLTLLRSRTMILISIGSCATLTAMAIGIYYIPLFFEFARSDTALRSAVRLLPFVIVVVFIMMLSGGTLPMHGRYNVLYIGSGAFMLAAGACMYSLIHPDTSPTQIYGFEVLLAIGAGLAQQTAYTIAVMEVVAKATGDPRDAISKAICLINVAQIGGIAVSLSIAGCIYENVGFIKLRDALVKFDFSESQIREGLGGAHSAILATTSEGGNDVVRQLGLAAITATMNQVFLLIVVAGSLCLLAGLAMKWEKISLAV